MIDTIFTYMLLALMVTTGLLTLWEILRLMGVTGKIKKRLKKLFKRNRRGQLVYMDDYRRKRGK